MEWRSIVLRSEDQVRDDFPQPVKNTLAARAAYRCSRCGAATSGPQVDPTKSVNVGVAAHVTGAAPGGPRYDPTLSPEERSGVENGIWLCQTCAKLIDDDTARFPLAELRRLKSGAEANAAARVGIAVGRGAEQALSSEEIEILYHASVQGDLWFFKGERGRWIRSGNRDFADEHDQAYAETYIEALESLVRRRLVRHEDDIAFRLTAEGFRVARELASPRLERTRLMDERFERIKGEYKVRGTPKPAIDAIPDLTQEERADLYDRAVIWKKSRRPKSNPYRDR